MSRSVRAPKEEGKRGNGKDHEISGAPQADPNTFDPGGVSLEKKMSRTCVFQKARHGYWEQNEKNRLSAKIRRAT